MEITPHPAAQNLKPAVKTMPPRGGSTAKTTNQKTIGINKLGTLLSSQTTDTPGTTTTKQTVADRSGATFQTYPIPHPNTNPTSRIRIEMKTAPTDFQRPEGQPDFGFDLGFLAAR
ncbi:hypothetical protein ACX5I6_03645 [Arthrobacter sp. MMS24-T111]